MMSITGGAVLLGLVVLSCTIVGATTKYQLNKAIMENEKVGESMAKELSKMLEDPSMPANDTKLLEDEISAEISRAGNGSAAGGRGVSLAKRSLPYGVICRKTCCKVVVPPSTRSYTVSVSYQSTEYYTYYYYTSCGFFLWGRCTRSRTRSRPAIHYYQDTRYYSVPRPCPSDKKTCCEGYFWFRSCCLSVHELERIMREIRWRSG